MGMEQGEKQKGNLKKQSEYPAQISFHKNFQGDLELHVENQRVEILKEQVWRPTELLGFSLDSQFLSYQILKYIYKLIIKAEWYRYRSKQQNGIHMCGNLKYRDTIQIIAVRCTIYWSINYVRKNGYPYRKNLVRHVWIAQVKN